MLRPGCPGGQPGRLTSEPQPGYVADAMKIRALASRTLVLQLLLTLPTVAGARLALDIEQMGDSRGHVESRHDSGCPHIHDHALCTLLFRTPWSPAPLTQRLTPSAAVIRAPLSKGEGRQDDGLVRLPVARGPPHSS